MIRKVFGGIKIKCNSFLFCSSSGTNEEFQVVLGGVNIDKQEDMDQTIPVIRTILHENYRDARVAVYNDIGLILFIYYPFDLNFTDTISLCVNLLKLYESSCLSLCTPSFTQL